MATPEQITAFMTEAFGPLGFQIESAGPRQAVLRRPVGPADLRPGGTISGPTLMALADSALYVAIHATLGITPMAVTSSLNTHFLRRPAGDRALLADCRLIRVGRSQVVGEVSIRSEGQDEPVAHAVGTYALPSAAAVSGATP